MYRISCITCYLNYNIILYALQCCSCNVVETTCVIIISLPPDFVRHFDTVRRWLRTVSDEEIRVRPQAVVVQIWYVECPRVQNTDVARPQTVSKTFELR